MKDVNVLFMGTPVFAVPILEGLIENCNVIGVVSQPDKKMGRKQILVETPIKKKALENNILVLQPDKIKSIKDDIVNLNPDMIVTCAYGQIIPQDILDIPRLGCINVHASLLPKLRGGAPIHRALIEGYDKTGITIMYMDAKMDSGDIISQSETTIKDDDNLESLHDRLSLMGKELLVKTLPSIIDGSNNRIVQDNTLVTYGFNIERDEEHIDFSKNSQDILNLIRGLSPVPAANAYLDSLEMKIYNAYINKIKVDGCYGQITNIYKDGIGVKTNDFELVITEVKPFGKRRMAVRDYLNGINKSDLLSKVFK